MCLVRHSLNFLFLFFIYFCDSIVNVISAPVGY